MTNSKFECSCFRVYAQARGNVLLYRSKDFEDLPDGAKELLMALLQHDPVKRLSVREALDHPYFTTWSGSGSGSGSAAMREEVVVHEDDAACSLVTLNP